MFRHPGRELNQQSEASTLEKEKAQKSELDNFRGIPIKREKGVRFNQWLYHGDVYSQSRFSFRFDDLS